MNISAEFNGSTANNFPFVEERMPPTASVFRDKSHYLHYHTGYYHIIRLRKTSALVELSSFFFGGEILVNS